MSPLVTLLLVTLVSQCWAAPQRRNWTPQAMLYLKGAQGHRSALERSSRGGDAAPRLVALVRSGEEPSSTLVSSVLLQLLQRAVEEGGGSLEIYPADEEEELNL